MVKKLDNTILDEFRDIDGFPIGEDKDIIDLSEAPYYTAYPNPYIENFIHENGKTYYSNSDNYQKQPLTSDVSENKHDPIYNVHSYHTKIPPKAIMHYILHYTEPGDVIFDGFCGTGMTGIAAQLCEGTIHSIKNQINKEASNIKWGRRKVILCDLSPLATFISFNYNFPMNKVQFVKKSNEIINSVEQKYGWVYTVNHSADDKIQPFDETHGHIHYTVWSDMLICPECTQNFLFWDAALDQKNDAITKEYKCPSCKTILNNTLVEKQTESYSDSVSKGTLKRTKRIPVRINYFVGKKGNRFVKVPENSDLDIINQINDLKISNWYPTNKMMFVGQKMGRFLEKRCTPYYFKYRSFLS